MAEDLALSKKRPAFLSAPNVLLIVLDTVLAASLSLYGYERTSSPHLEQFARTGVRFDHALSTAPWTLPSLASMFTGHYPHELSADWERPLDASKPTLAEVLRSRGYRTAGFVANSLYCSRSSGLNRGFSYYEDFTLSPGQLVASSSLGRMIANNPNTRRIIGYPDVLGRKRASGLNANFLNWLSSWDRARPFFVFLNYFDAHSPYLPPEPFDELFGPKKPRRNPNLAAEWQWTSEDVQAERDAYDRSIAYIDYHLGVLFDELEARGALENTLTIIASDHGEGFGKHRVMGHGNSIYLSSIHVPLLISCPRACP